MEIKKVYKLTMVEVKNDKGWNNIAEEVCLLGIFKSEYALAEWARSNDGCLDTENKD